MRIALVIAGPYPAFRGSQVLVSHLAAGLRARGHQVHLVTISGAVFLLPTEAPEQVADVIVEALRRAVRYVPDRQQ